MKNAEIAAVAKNLTNEEKELLDRLYDRGPMMWEVGMDGIEPNTLELLEGKSLVSKKTITPLKSHYGSYIWFSLSGLGFVVHQYIHNPELFTLECHTGESKETLGEQIRERREAHGMTQKDIGEARMVSPQCVSKWEMGKCLQDLYTLPDVLRALQWGTATITVGNTNITLRAAAKGNGELMRSIPLPRNPSSESPSAKRNGDTFGKFQELAKMAEAVCSRPTVELTEEKYNLFCFLRSWNPNYDVGQFFTDFIQPHNLRNLRLERGAM